MVDRGSVVYFDQHLVSSGLPSCRAVAGCAVLRIRPNSAKMPSDAGANDAIIATLLRVRLCRKRNASNNEARATLRPCSGLPRSTSRGEASGWRSLARAADHDQPAPASRSEVRPPVGAFAVLAHCDGAGRCPRRIPEVLRRRHGWCAASARSDAPRRALAIKIYERIRDDYERESAAVRAQVGLVTPYTRVDAWDSGGPEGPRQRTDLLLGGRRGG
jgi:hypothetical protein